MSLMPLPAPSRHRLRTLTVAKIAAITASLMMATSAYAALARSSPAPTPLAGTYQGLVGPDSISFKVSADQTKVTGLSTTFNPAADCGVPTSQVHESFGPLKIDKGHFSGRTTVTEGTPTTFSIQGHFTSRTKATGRISGHFKVKSLPACDAESTFSVKRKGG